MCASSSRADSPDAALSSDGSHVDHDSVSGVSINSSMLAQIPQFSDYQLPDDELDGDSPDDESLEGYESNDSESDDDEYDDDEPETDELDSGNSDDQIAGDESNVISVSYSPGHGNMVEKNAEGVFSLNLQLESHIPFSVLQTVTLMEGPPKGFQVILMKPRPPLHFLDLPREIRDEVYEYAMVPHAQYRVNCSTKHHHESRIFFRMTQAQPDHPKRHIPYELEIGGKVCWLVSPNVPQESSVSPGLLRVNRQVYHEARQILYEKNTFQMRAWTVESFLVQIGSADQQIRYLNLVDLGRYGVQRTKEMLAKLTHLKHLGLVGKPLSDKDKHYSPFMAATEIYRKMYTWIDCVGKLHGDCFAALERLAIQAGPTQTPRTTNAHLVGQISRRNHVAEYYAERRLPAEQLEWDKNFREELKVLITLDNSNKTFRFLDLPRKLRDKIYQIAMKQEYHWNGSHENERREISIWQFLKTGRVRRRIRLYDENYSDNFRFCDSLTPGLLLANRQVHDESKMILYGTNHFKFDREDTLGIFLNIIGSSVTLLRSVDVGTYPKNAALWPKLWHLNKLMLHVEPDDQRRFRFFPRRLERNSHVMLVDRDPEAGTANGFERLCSPEVVALAFFKKARSWIDGVGTVHRDKFAAVSRVYITMSTGVLEPDVLSDRFRTELSKLIASVDGE